MKKQFHPPLGYNMEELVYEYNPRLYKTISRFTRSHEETEDILQEVWIRVMKGLPRFRGNSDIYTWLYRIAVNTAFRILKRTHRNSPLKEEADLQETLHPEKESEKNNIQEILTRALSRLNNRYREIILLRNNNEMPYQEIAERLGITVSNAKTSHFLALKKLRNLLGESML